MTPTGRGRKQTRNEKQDEALTSAEKKLAKRGFKGETFMGSKIRSILRRNT